MDDVGTLIDITPEIDHRRGVERFARLAGLVERQAAEIARNPRSFLDRAYEAVSARDRLFEEVKRAVYPPIRACSVNDHIEIVDHLAEARMQISMVRNIIDRWETTRSIAAQRKG
jgi:hypothetical protein